VKFPIFNFLLLSAAAFYVPAHASTWNYLNAGNDNARYYFDGDTVDKIKDRTVSLWIKSVQTKKADSDGSWATAYRWKISCANRTIQTLTSSNYDQNGAFMNSASIAGPVSVAVPDSVGEAIMKIACEPNFPNDTSGNSYFKIIGNDVFKTTKYYTASYLTPDPAPK